MKLIQYRVLLNTMFHFVYQTQQNLWPIFLAASVDLNRFLSDIPREENTADNQCHSLWRYGSQLLVKIVDLIFRNITVQRTDSDILKIC